MQKVKKITAIIGIAAWVTLGVGLFALPASAANETTNTTDNTTNITTNISTSTEQPDCAVLPTSVCSKSNDGSAQGGIFELLKWVLKIMTVLVGVAAVAGIIWAGILYGSAGDNTAQVKQSKTIITDVIIGIIAYGLMIVFINWLVPGGVF